MNAPTPDEWRTAGRYLDWRGHRIFYRDEGSGAETVLLIHGFPTASWDWHRIWPGLAARGRVIAFDMLGFGFSSKPYPYDYRLVQQADIAEALCAELGVDAVHVLAHDYGVSVAQELLARREGGRTSGAARLGLRSVCFLNGGLFPETHHARPIQKLLLTPLGPLVTLLWSQRAFNRSLAAVFGPATQPTPDELQHYWSLVTAGNGRRLLPALIRYIPERRLNRERWLAAMQSTDVPLRLVDGPLDPVSGAHMAARYRELVPDPDVVLLPGIGHYPQMEDPGGVLEAYLAFLDRLRSE